MRRRVPSLERAKKLIDWRPKRTLDEIIGEARDWQLATGRF
jgi:nucleoside-diphosphate-sugar epimerase